MPDEKLTYGMSLEEKASEIGRTHGENAASWHGIDATNARRTFDGIEDGDPEILDSLPGPDLLGQWSDEYSSRDLYEELEIISDSGVERPMFDAHSIFDAYELAFSEAVEFAITRKCREILSEETE